MKKINDEQNDQKTREHILDLLRQVARDVVKRLRQEQGLDLQEHDRRQKCNSSRTSAPENGT